VFHDLFDAEEAIELEIRATLLRGLEQWLAGSGLTQIEAAKVLGVTQARVSDIKRGKISQFSLDLLVRLAARAGLRPKLKLAA
jgi:predicted XRE-type DNA-binding protein